MREWYEHSAQHSAIDFVEGSIYLPKTVSEEKQVKTLQWTTIYHQMAYTTSLSMAGYIRIIQNEVLCRKW